MSTLFAMLLVAFALEGPTPAHAESDPAPVRVTVALLPGSTVTSGELVTVEARVVPPPAGQPGADVELTLVDLLLPDGRVLAMAPTPADPNLYTQHVFADRRLGPGRHELEVVVGDSRGRERAVTLVLEVVPGDVDVAVAQ